MNQAHLESARKIIEQSQSFLIVSHERPTADSVGSILTFYLALQSLGKKVTVALPEPITVEHSHFVGANKIVNEVGKKHFVISLDYTEGSIEKVSYNIEGKTFNLVIEPRDGFDSFTQDKVHFSQAGANVDAIVIVDTIHLGGLKKLYETNKDIYASKPIINIDRHPNNSNFGQVNIVDPHVSSTVELIYEVIKGLGVTITQDMATNVLNALFSATNNFTSANVSAKAFEIAAEVSRLGGKKFQRTVSMPVSEEIPVEEHAVTESIEANPVSMPGNLTQETPPDWLKPKIFKSSNVG